MIFGKSDVGLVRKNNQDNHIFDAQQGIVVVADGIGGRKGGEVASALAVKGFMRLFMETQLPADADVASFIQTASSSVNKGIIAKGLANPNINGMATTLNCIIFTKDRAYIGNLGDSRTYLYFRGNLWRLTFDHSVQSYVERGWLPDGILVSTTKSGALLKALGLTEVCEADVFEVDLQLGLLFLTCSDGLTNMVSDAEILRLIDQNIHQINRLPDILVDAANQHGGRDNITVVISAVKRG